MTLNPAAERTLQRGLLALAGIFAIWTVTEVFMGRDADGGIAAIAAATTMAPTVRADESAAIDDYAVIVDRPLFFETRRPYEAVQVADAGPAETEPAAGLVLSAVIITDDRRIAIVEAGQNEVQRLVPGESIQGWTLTGIEPQRALFTRGGETLTLELTVPASGPGAGRRPESRPPAPAPATPTAEPAADTPQADDKSSR